ncbi:MAG: ABC transporter substrate-binding protein [Defluviitaleaceae bacterium]|nr:ABC transporter substrate-binding protein [Defluviitaleaceae bacterium]
MKKTLALILSFVLLISLLSGCADDTAPVTGGGTTGGTVAGSNGGGEEVTFTGDPIYFAMHHPATGDAAEYGLHYLIASQIAMDRVNSRGGVLGRELRIIPYDTVNRPQDNADIARLVVANPRYLIALGDYASSGVLASLPIYEEAGMVVFTPSASGPIIGQSSPFAFQMFGLQTDDAPFAAREILQGYLGAERVGVIHFNTDWGFMALENFQREADRIGLELTNIEPINTGEVDFRAILSNIRQNDPDAIYIMANYSEVAGIVNQITQMGWDVQVVPSKTAITGSLIEMLGEDLAEGLITNLAFVVRPGDTYMIEYTAEFERRAGVPTTYWSYLVYDTIMGIVDAIERLGEENLSREAMVDALMETNKYGLLGQWEFNEHGQVHRRYYIMRFESGSWVQVSDFDENYNIIILDR